MHQQLLPIYGPLAINSFGLMIIVGLVVFSALFLSDPKRARLISIDDYCNALSLAILVAIVGGRALFVITNLDTFTHWSQAFEFWQGGFSLLGGLLALVLFLPLYLHTKRVPMIALLDLAAIYAPLLQAISRVGCFLAGCCYGLPTPYAFGVINPHCSLTTPLHPTQLYSAVLLLCIFFVMYGIMRNRCTKPGQLITSYLFFMSIERFTVDFWRADRQYFSHEWLNFFSIPQWIALAIAAVSFFLFCHISCKRRTP